MTRELSDEARSLIRHAVAEERPPGPAHRERLRHAILARAAAGGVVTLVGASVAKASTPSLFSVVATSVGVGFGAGLVLIGAAELALNPSATAPRADPTTGVAARGTNEPRAALARPLPSAMAPAATVPPASSEASEEPSPVNTAAAEARELEVAPSATAGSALRAELDLMAQVQEALRDGRGARALELIAHYDTQYPSGMLETERLAAEVFAACQTGDAARARRVAARFLARDSVSALAERVKHSCAFANREGQ